MKILLVSCILLGLSISTFAKTSLNSICYKVDQHGSTIHGDYFNDLFELASVSKVVTTHWAIRQFGPHFRFRTRIHITPVGKNLFDVHIQGSQDPFWGRQLMHFLFSELFKNDVREIRKLSFDENFRFRWSVISEYIDSHQAAPQEIEGALQTHLKNLSIEYTRTVREAAALGMKLPKTLSITAHSVSYLPSFDFKMEAETVTYYLRSAPLYRYLKEMNSVSNNYVADQLFDYLGGREKFERFIQQDMNMDSSDIKLINGSGNSVVAINADGVEVKEYNKGSCNTMMRILMNLHAELQGKFALDLKDVMAVSGTDKGTLKPRYDSIHNVVVAKTGTVDPAVNLAGMISTAQGNVYFGIFMGTDSPADWNNARDQVRERLLDLMDEFGGKKSFNYTALGFIPFDQYSGMTTVVKNLKTNP